MHVLSRAIKWESESQNLGWRWRNWRTGVGGGESEIREEKCDCIKNLEWAVRTLFQDLTSLVQTDSDRNDEKGLFDGPFLISKEIYHFHPSIHSSPNNITISQPRLASQVPHSKWQFVWMSATSFKPFSHSPPPLWINIQSKVQGRQ